MAGISQKISPSEVLPLVARNASVLGYHEATGSKGEPTEYLLLLKNYIEQSRDLVRLAGSEEVIHASDCDNSKLLLTVLGYKVRGGCGSSAVLETDNPDRAFLTIDSGFPLADLEETLRGGKPFSYAYPSAHVPMMFAPSEWATLDKNKPAKPDVSFLDTLLRDPLLDRLYWSFSRIDSETAESLRQSPGLDRLLPYAPVLDFYGSHISIRSGAVLVPGGPPAESSWKDLVGASPRSPGDFVIKLLARDDGWLAVYFDSLSRASQAKQAYFTDSGRLGKFYAEVRGRDLATVPAKPVLRPDPGILIPGHPASV